MKLRGDPGSARFINRALVLEKLKFTDSVSRAELARQLGLSKITISEIVADLIKEDLIEETGEGNATSTGGRKPILLRLNESWHRVIGLDIGLTNTVIALGGLKGERVVQLRVPTCSTHDVDSILGQIEELIGTVLARGSIPRDKVAGIGISIRGLIDGRSGHIAFSPALDWRDVPFRDLVEERLGLPTTLDNCTRAMAFGEKWHEKSNDIRNIFYVNLGYGIGSAIVMNGRIYNNNSEFGHIKITNRDVLCDCGKKGCLEAVASGHAIGRFADAALGPRVSGAGYSAKDVADMAFAGNQKAREIFRDASRYLGRAISIATNLFNPDKVVIAGGIANARELIEEPLMDEYRATAMEVIKKSTVVTFSSFGMDAGIIGAISLALNRYVFHEEAVLAAGS
ncbi:MAG: ROK family protein [Spirochaetia bacterium]|jgi:predicted NBD/HSP70 family sugar kinase